MNQLQQLNQFKIFTSKSILSNDFLEDNDIQMSDHFNWMNLILKRAIDLLGAFIFMATIGFWLFPIIAILIKLESPGPVFFRQERGGIYNSRFRCYKFRSMVVNKEADIKQATKNDPRITKVGRFIRRTSIDELPQILNVIYGNMSLVGPRPHPIKLNEMSAATIPGFNNRHLVKPGITGLAQAKGYRGETQTFHQMYFRYKLDLHYIKTWSPIMDLKIIWMTFISILTDNENAH
ncbi:sugar transferase [Algoriphagus halophilus]|uniref:Putative colanic acid biosysnthesis UDP-glucose lipid carrier transferase n=1 Tax=Algoriphagus halophilus TaxID=226505 RepID=A0A1N6E928_9BACT|nr:sugar transferase [Algoriphagus halophilus]SIN79506.1 putative colanic acid biosysnthesis UDP-glucose lipid carrier transferase [Algoriphagus halophilus]